MTQLQLTPDHPPADTLERPDAEPDVDAPGPEGSPDEMHLAEAARLERYEIERAADEGMTESVDPLPDPGFEEDH
jgi:hypothetical protein